ncbi:MAG: AsmA-like C-terminal region-containing protein [Azonexus sp.]|nr:AsmA-like C-terminal region-containing protein [Azonexus sp.]
MDPKLVYATTPTGDEAVRQSSRVVQRNLRMVLVQIDGNLTVEELAAKIGNLRLVENALRELEEGGFVAPTLKAASIWEDSKLQTKREQLSALSQFSTFGPKSVLPPSAEVQNQGGNNFSTFGKPVLPTSRKSASASTPVIPEQSPESAHDGGEGRGAALKWVLGGLASVSVLLIGAVLFYPYNNLKPAIEGATGRLFQAPVKIGQISLVFTPLPQLKLEDIRIGEADDSRIESVRIASPQSLLGSGPHLIASADVVGATLSANRVVAFLGLPSASAASGPIFRRIRIEQSQVTVRDLALRDVFGEILFKADGAVEKASFQAVDRSIRLEAVPTPQGIVLNIEGLGWKPGGIPVSFDSLQAKGLLQKDKLLIQNLDTTFLGGILKGNWLLDWSTGLVMAGDATLARLDCRKVSAAFVPTLKLEGDLGGTLRLRAGGNNWEGMWNSAEAMLDADITRGILHGVDLGESARRGVGSIVRSGATKFDRLHAAISINQGQIKGQDVRMDAGMMTATGQFAANSERLVEANLTVGIQTSVSSLRVPVRVSGVLPELTAYGSK